MVPGVGCKPRTSCPWLNPPRAESCTASFGLLCATALLALVAQPAPARPAHAI